MYLISINRRIVWRWSYVRTLKYAEVMLHNRKTRDSIMQKYFRLDASACITRSVLGIFIYTFEEDFMWNRMVFISAS